MPTASPTAAFTAVEANLAGRAQRALIPLSDDAARVFARNADEPAEVGSAWRLGPGPRGEAIEQFLGHNVPPSYPKIEIWRDGQATSIKSIDLTAKSYATATAAARADRNMRAARSLIEGYVDKAAGFKGANWGNLLIRESDITSRGLILAIPQGSASLRQLTMLQSMMEYAQSKNVLMRIVEVP